MYRIRFEVLFVTTSKRLETLNKVEYQAVSNFGLSQVSPERIEPPDPKTKSLVVLNLDCVLTTATDVTINFERDH